MDRQQEQLHLLQQQVLQQQQQNNQQHINNNNHIQHNIRPLEGPYQNRILQSDQPQLVIQKPNLSATLQSRREDHRMVERRRRETINVGIEQLSMLVPGKETNKGKVIHAAISYIKQLISEVCFLLMH